MQIIIFFGWSQAFPQGRFCKPYVFFTIRHLACEEERLAAVRLLLEHNASTSMVNKAGKSPLQMTNTSLRHLTHMNELWYVWFSVEKGSQVLGAFYYLWSQKQSNCFTSVIHLHISFKDMTKSGFKNVRFFSNFPHILLFPLKSHYL